MNHVTSDMEHRLKKPVRHTGLQTGVPGGCITAGQERGAIPSAVEEAR